MATVVYLMPLIGTGTAADPRRAKYHLLMAASGYSAMDFGNQAGFIVATEDNPAVTAQADVIRLGIDDNLPVSQLTIIQNFLQSVGIERNWCRGIGRSKEIGRLIANLCLFLQETQQRDKKAKPAITDAHRDEWLLRPVPIGKKVVL